MYKLGFSTEFVDESRFKVIYEGRDQTYYYKQNSYYDNYFLYN